MSGPHARSLTMGRRLFLKEEEIFEAGVSWAMCFYRGLDPMIRNFQPPQAGPLGLQGLTLYVPFQHLYTFCQENRTGYGASVPRLRDCAAHCRLKVYKCDASGAPRHWSHTLHARYTQVYHDGHFIFCGDRPARGAILEPGYYFIVCDFFSTHWENDHPDATYTTGTFIITSPLSY
ncbi:hypothetical protein F5B17DRAFT_382801 [Nemania serpens]|nr:hypothetical protein F5B17DRAFT_382801 [Nemania serpens]